MHSAPFPPQMPALHPKGRTQLLNEVHDAPKPPLQLPEAHDSDDAQWMLLVQVAPFPPHMPELHPRGDAQLLDDVQDAPKPPNTWQRPETHVNGAVQSLLVVQIALLPPHVPAPQLIVE